MTKLRQLDKLVDELAKGWPMEKILRLSEEYSALLKLFSNCNGNLRSRVLRTLVPRKACHAVSKDVWENIRLGRPGATDAEVEQAAKDSGCHEFILGQERGYDTPVGSSGGHLSAGERQRISIARAILKAAPIVIPEKPPPAPTRKTKPSHSIRYALFHSPFSYAWAVTRISSRSNAEALPRGNLTSRAPCFLASFCALMTMGWDTVSIQTKM